MKGIRALFSRKLRLAGVLGLVLATPLLVVTTGQRPASASNVVNVTIHVPASVQTNPCFPTDVVNLSGDIHIVITSTDDGNGGLHINKSLNSQLSGVSITTGTKYVNSENQQYDWYARPPFPAVQSQTYDFLLVSQNNTPNYVLHMTMHETVDANGVPTATVDNFSMDCAG